jgi:hypothetical protein
MYIRTLSSRVFFYYPLPETSSNFNPRWITVDSKKDWKSSHPEGEGIEEVLWLDGIIMYVS